MFFGRVLWVFGGIQLVAAQAVRDGCFFVVSIFVVLSGFVYGRARHIRVGPGRRLSFATCKRLINEVDVLSQ
jgi:hypothetical protein